MFTAAVTLLFLSLVVSNWSAYYINVRRVPCMLNLKTSLAAGPSPKNEKKKKEILQANTCSTLVIGDTLATCVKTKNTSSFGVLLGAYVHPFLTPKLWHSWEQVLVLPVAMLSWLRCSSASSAPTSRLTAKMQTTTAIQLIRPIMATVRTQNTLDLGRRAE